MDVDDLPRKDVPTLFSNRFTEAIEPQPIDYCDIHDLLAVVVAQTQNVAAFRINGQLAFQIARKDHDCAVRVLKWKPDGSLLGVGWSDGMVGVYSGEDGKLMSQTTVRKDEARDEWKLDLVVDDVGLDGDEEPSLPACIGWTMYSTQARQAAPISTGYHDTLIIEDWYDVVESDRKLTNGLGVNETSFSRLANSIATLDITAVLPRLSALPVHIIRFGPNEQKFTTQAGVDTLFDAARNASDDITTFVTSSASGHTNFYLGDSVSLCHFPISAQTSYSTLASHPLCISQVVLSHSTDEQPFRLDYIDPPLRKLSGSLLRVVTTQTTRIQNLLGYITQTLRCMQSDMTSNLQLPTRIIANISEELSSQGEDDLITSLYHLAMIGTFSPCILEWLTESIRDNTYKRWDKAVNDMYNHIQNHIFVNLVPALDRLAIAADAIRGHARTHEGTDNFVPPGPFTHLMDDVDSMRVTAHKLQLLVIAEHRQFRDFSKWLRLMIEVGTAGPGSKAAIEIEEREVPNIDYTLVLAYIKDTLLQSKLTSFLEQRPDMKGISTQSDFWNHAGIATSTHDQIITAIRHHDAEHPGNDEGKSTSLLNLPALAIRLTGQARLAIESITKWQSEMLSQPETIPIDYNSLSPDSKILDVRLSPHTEDNRSSTTSILSVPDDSEYAPLSLLRITRTQTGKYDTSSATFPLPPGQLLHATMLDQDRCIALMKRAEEANHVLISCNLQAYSAQNDNWLQVLHLFAADSGFEPASLAVGGRPGKLVCVVCALDGRGWKVFDLHHGSMKGKVATMYDYDRMGL